LIPNEEWSIGIRIRGAMALSSKDGMMGQQWTCVLHDIPAEADRVLPFVEAVGTVRTE